MSADRRRGRPARVVVVGAGLGGLTLAHGLRAAGVDVAVHERSPSTGPQPASYGIHVNVHGNRALHACLPAENWARYDRSAVPAPDVVRFRGAGLGSLTDVALGSAADDADPIGHRRAVRRGPLHRALLDGLDDVVRRESTFTSYTELPDGRLRATFADGTTDDADLLVGADGANSRVRGQYLPGLRRQDLGILTVAGRLPLGHPAARALPADMVDGSVNNVVPARPGWLFASTWPGGTDEDDHLVWAYVADRAVDAAGVATLAPADLRRWVTTRVADWDPRIADVVAASEADTVAPVTLRSMPALPTWRPSAVTLLGDAVHTMTPLAGIGATTALRDADVLREALTAPGPATLVDRIGRYEERMRAYADPALALSTRNARNAASPRRLPRLAFRTLLRASDAAPPVKRAVFPGAVRPGSP